MDALLPEYRAVIVLKDVDGFKNREIAEILECSLATVKIRLHRGRAMLRESLVSGCTFSRDARSVLVCEPKRGGACE
jgi:RNA polymerase sigma-70 factor (ECF subfamily)